MSRPLRIKLVVLCVMLPSSGCGNGHHIPPGIPATTSTITSKSGIEMVSIPAGSFAMGSQHGRDEERPAHQVWVDAFLIDRREVTQGEYEKLGQIEAFPNPSHFKGADLPVEQVTWPQAARFCN